MTFVTALRLQSGDRAVLDDVVDDIKRAAERKGAQLKGPHSHPPMKCSVPQYWRLCADDERRLEPWLYTVYTRELEIHGHQDFARSVAEREFPESLRLEVEIEQVRGVGR